MLSYKKLMAITLKIKKKKVIPPLIRALNEGKCV